jgi:adenylosuccinate synthase
MNSIKHVDICCGLAWGDEAKGKLVTELLKHNDYDWVCRWAGGSNAGHTIYYENVKYNTNIVPSGVFYNKKCYIGPQCYVNLNDLDKEMEYLHNNGFNINTIKVSKNVHIISDEHKEEDIKKYKQQQGSTGKGIAPCARDKYGRKGIQLKTLLQDSENFKNLKYFNPNTHIMIEQLEGNILCEGAQGFWLDIDFGNYPYVTSSCTLPYSACSLGFPPQYIRNIYGAAKIYDTRVGIDTEFSDDLLNDETLNKIAHVGNEFGTTTGRLRKVNWLNLEKLIEAINISGTTHVIISKTDILEKIGIFKLSNGISFPNLETMKKYIYSEIQSKCVYIKRILFSDNPKTIKF